MTAPFVPESKMPLPHAIPLYLLDRLSAFQCASRSLADPNRSVVVETVHDLRVICRQILSVLEAFSPWLRLKKLHPVLKGTRRINRFLGPVRDLDILLTHQELPPLGRAKAEQQRSEALAALSQACSGKQLEKTLEHMRQLLIHPDVEILLAPVPISEKGRVRMDRLGSVAPAVLFRLAAAITAYRGVITRSAGGATPPEILHQLRIQCKTFRYTTAMLRPLLGQPADDMIRAFKQLQDLLGAIHDQDFLILTLSRMERAASMDSAIDAALESVQQKRQALLEDFLAVWDSMDEAWFTRRIGASILEGCSQETANGGQKVAQS